MLRLKEIRQEKGMSQEDVAKFLNITRASYTNIENGKRDPDSNTIILLARFFDVSTDRIFGIGENAHGRYTEEEKQLIRDYRKLNNAGREHIRQTLYTAVVSGLYEKVDNNASVENKTEAS